MKPLHVGFFVEPVYGHVIPTLGITLELLRRGHRVSYAVTPQFAPFIERYGARAITFSPIKTRSRLHEVFTEGQADFHPGDPHLTTIEAELRKQRTADSVSQLFDKYVGDVPDIVVHDDCFDSAGKTLAAYWQVPRIRHDPVLLSKKRMHRYADSDDELILVSAPDFLNEDPEYFDGRFRSIGFIAEGRREFREPWPHEQKPEQTIVVCPTTGLLAQTEFCNIVIEAFRGTRWQVILSIPSGLDPECAIDPSAIAPLPDNFRLNQHSATLELLERACLFINQGGQGGALEALYSGVPTLLVPVSYVHEVLATRFVDLGLGRSIPYAGVSAQKLRENAESLIADTSILDRVKKAQATMRAQRGATVAADLIEERLRC